MPEKIVYDSIDICPYLPDQLQRTPLRHQSRPLTPSECDVSLAQGDRRSGTMLYRTECPTCKACEPLRVPVQDFQPSKSQRRILRKNEDVKVTLGPAVFSQEKLQLYNQHKSGRELSRGGSNMSKFGYENWFLHSCLDTKEFLYYVDDRLVGVSIADFGDRDISSVYFYFDPTLESRSLGTFSALFEMNWMKEQGMRYYYLGLYVADCSHLNYKSRYYPHHRLVRGTWMEFLNSKESRVLIDGIG